MSCGGQKPAPPPSMRCVPGSAAGQHRRIRPAPRPPAGPPERVPGVPASCRGSSRPCRCSRRTRRPDRGADPRSPAQRRVAVQQSRLLNWSVGEAAGLGDDLRRPPHHGRDEVGRDPCRAGDQLDVGAEGGHRLQLLGGEGVRADDPERIALHRADEGQRAARRSAGVLDDVWPGCRCRGPPRPRPSPAPSGPCTSPSGCGTRASPTPRPSRAPRASRGGRSACGRWRPGRAAGPARRSDGSRSRRLLGFGGWHGAGPPFAGRGAMKPLGLVQPQRPGVAAVDRQRDGRDAERPGGARRPSAAAGGRGRAPGARAARPPSRSRPAARRRRPGRASARSRRSRSAPRPCLRAAAGPRPGTARRRRGQEPLRVQLERRRVVGEACVEQASTHAGMSRPRSIGRVRVAVGPGGRGDGDRGVEVEVPQRRVEREAGGDDERVPVRSSGSEPEQGGSGVPAPARCRGPPRPAPGRSPCRGGPAPRPAP